MHEMWKRQQVHEDAKEMCRTETLGDNFKAQNGKMGKAACAKTRTTRRVDSKGEVLIWCRKCSGYARHRMEPKLMNCCKPDNTGTKEYATILKRIQVLKEGIIPSKEARGKKIERQRKGLLDKRIGDCRTNLGLDASWLKKKAMEYCQAKMLEERGASPEEDGNLLR